MSSTSRGGSPPHHNGHPPANSTQAPPPARTREGSQSSRGASRSPSRSLSARSGTSHYTMPNTGPQHGQNNQSPYHQVQFQAQSQVIPPQPPMQEILNSQYYGASMYDNNPNTGYPYSVPQTMNNTPMLYPQQMYVPTPSPVRLPGNVFNRKKTVKKIPLTKQGNLVIDIPVPDRVVQMGEYTEGSEFTHTRYTAITCGPDEFVESGYTLRQQEKNRCTELFIVVTMYNEDDELLCKSLASLQRNIAYLCSRSKSKTWGDRGWEKATICIVSDGRNKINSRVLDVLGIMGVYQDGIMKDHVNGKPVQAHLFEYTTQIAVSENLKIKGHSRGYVPTQVMFCLKEKNAKKINSHRWFFNAFGALLRPEVCILIDCGTKPKDHALYHLWKAFDRNQNVGGACGEIYAELGYAWGNCLNPLVAAQNFEYKMANILDKPLESVLGYISVLPGAFSAYRYKAVQGTPLQMYFKGESMHGPGTSIMQANMYLAEDRILCFELCTKKNEKWLLKYVKAAKAETDVPSTVPEFISQRRRWLNGSFFASVHALTHWFYIFRSSHNILRKILLMFEFVYNLVNLLFSWFGISFFFMTFYFLAYTSSDDKDAVNSPFPNPYSLYVFQVLQQIYLLCIVLVFLCALGNRPQGSKWLYTFCMFLFAFIMGVMLFYCFWNVYQASPHSVAGWKNFGQLIRSEPIIRDIVLSLASTYGLYLVSSLIYLDPWHMFTSFIQYLFLMPSFINILMVYAFCNIHDISWGTKGDNGAATDLGSVTVQKTKDGQQIVEVEVVSERTDINANYDRFITDLRKPRPPQNNHRDARTKQEDYYRTFRTRLILTWLVCNMAVIIVLTSEGIRNSLYAKLGVNGGDGATNPYLAFIFYSVLGLSTIRFFFCVLYVILDIFHL